MVDITKLTEEERLDLRVRLEFAERKTARDYSYNEKALWESILALFPARKRKIDAFVTDYGVHKFSDCAEDLADLVARASPGATKTMATALRNIILESLFRYIKSGNRPFGPATILDNLDKAEFSCDQDYPHYVRNGMLALVVTWARK